MNRREKLIAVTVAVFVEVVHVGVSDRVGIAGLRRDAIECVRIPDAAVEPDLRSDPERAFPILQDHVDAVVAQRRGVGRHVTVV